MTTYKVVREFRLPRILEVQKIETADGDLCITTVRFPSQLRVCFPKAQSQKTDPPLTSYDGMTPFLKRGES